MGFSISANAGWYAGGNFGIAQLNDSDWDDPAFGGVTLEVDYDTVLSFQVGAGVAIAVTPKANIDLKYRYFKTEDVDFDTSEFTYSSHNFYVGFRYNF